MVSNCAWNSCCTNNGNLINKQSYKNTICRTTAKEKKPSYDTFYSVLSFWNKKRGIPSPFLKEIIEAALEKHILNIEYHVTKPRYFIHQIVSLK